MAGNITILGGGLIGDMLARNPGSYVPGSPDDPRVKGKQVGAAADLGMSMGPLSSKLPDAVMSQAAHDLSLRAQVEDKLKEGWDDVSGFVSGAAKALFG